VRQRTTAITATAAVGLVALVAIGLLAAPIVVFRAQSGSMSPAISTGDIVIAERTGTGAPARSDIVVFDDPGGWAADVARLTGTEGASTTFVKRVIGLPGERVACCDDSGRITIDGAPLDEPYLADSGALASVLAFDVVVPDGEMLVLGDDRAASIDSRYLGAVPLRYLVAIERTVLRMP
jgi:signal peptidase I